MFRSSDRIQKYDHTSLIATVLKWRGIDPKTAGLGDRVAHAPTFEAVLADELRSDVPEYHLPAGYATQGAECMAEQLGPNAIPPGVARGILARKGTREEIEMRARRWLAEQNGRTR